MKYVAELTAKFLIDAENIVEARRVAQRIRSMGEHLGSRRSGKTRDVIRYSCDRVSEKVKVKRV